MHIIVTGATGFVGGTLCRRLLERGDKIIALGRNQRALAVLAAAGARTIPLDLATDAVPSGLRADAMVHAAALSSPWGHHQAFADANVQGTRTAVATARAAGVRRFVQVSTPSVYFRLAHQLNLAEDHSLPKPINSYAATKRAAEELIAAASDLDSIILRPRGIYGAGDTALLPRLIRAARQRALPLVDGGRAVTDLTHVDDVVSAIVCALEASSDRKARLFNISGGVALNVCDVANKAAARAGVTVRWRSVFAPALFTYARAGEFLARMQPGRPEPALTVYSAGLLAFSQTLDISRARRELGWAPRIGFEEGLERTFAHAVP